MARGCALKLSVLSTGKGEGLFSTTDPLPREWGGGGVLVTSFSTPSSWVGGIPQPVRHQVGVEEGDYILVPLLPDPSLLSLGHRNYSGARCAIDMEIAFLLHILV